MAPGVAATATAADPAKAKGSQPWYELESTCIFCQKDDYACEYGPRSLLLCSCCPKGTHVECYEKAQGIELTKDFIDSGSSWFCSKVRNVWHGSVWGVVPALTAAITIGVACGMCGLLCCVIYSAEHFCHQINAISSGDYPQQQPYCKHHCTLLDVKPDTHALCSLVCCRGAKRYVPVLPTAHQTNSTRAASSSRLAHKLHHYFGQGMQLFV
jgi:hypothetical protein